MNGETPKSPFAWECGPYTRPSADPAYYPYGNMIALHTFTQVRNKVPISYDGMLHIQPQNCLFPLPISTSI